MSADSSRTRLLYKVAKAYYEDGLTQQEIGRRFGISRIRVSRLLQQAREERVVQIIISPQGGSHADLEREVEARYGLDEVVIVSAAGDDSQSITRALGPAAARCLLRSLSGSEVLALTWGTAVLSVVDAMPARHWPEMRVVQALGGLGQPEAEVHGAEVVRRLGGILGARPRLLSAPGIVPSRLVRDALLGDPQISDTLALAAQADVALVGIGVVAAANSVVRQAGTILTEAEIAALQVRGAVGDIALRFFDDQGRSIGGELADRVVGLDLAQLRRIPRVIGVAGGPAKLAAIRAALRGRLVHTLVTDEATGRALARGA